MAEDEEETDKLEEMRKKFEALQQGSMPAELKAAQESLLSHHALFFADEDEAEEKKPRAASRKAKPEAKVECAPETPALPDGWQSLVDPASKRIYFFNRALKKTQWHWPTNEQDAVEIPVEIPAQLEPIPAQPRLHRRSPGGFSKHLQVQLNGDSASEIASTAASSSEAGQSMEGREIHRLRSYNRGSAPPSYNSLARALENNSQTPDAALGPLSNRARMHGRGRGFGRSGYDEAPTEMFGGIQEYSRSWAAAAASTPRAVSSSAEPANSTAGVPSMEVLLASLDEQEVPEQPNWKDSGRRSTLGGLAASEPEEPRFGPVDGEESKFNQQDKGETLQMLHAKKASQKNRVTSTVMNAFAGTSFAKRSVKKVDTAEYECPDESERRVDPDTGQTYTWRRFQDRFSKEFTPEDTLAYWRYVCTPASDVEEKGGTGSRQAPDAEEEDVEEVQNAEDVQAHIEEAPGGGTLTKAETIDEILARIEAEEKQEEEAEVRRLEEQDRAVLEESAAGRFVASLLKRS